MRSHMAFAFVAFVGCGSAAPNPTDMRMTQPGADLAPASPTYCGAKGKTAILLSSCSDGCVPDEQVFFVCTEKRGRIAYTRQNLYKPQQFGYSLELDDARTCGDTPVKIWALTQLSPEPTAANAGKTTSSAIDSDTCLGLPVTSQFNFLNDRLYYSVAEVAQ